MEYGVPHYHRRKRDNAKMDMQRRDVELVEHETLCKSFFRLDKYRLRHRLFQGGWSGEIAREVFARGQAASVLLYDRDADKVVLVEQFRPGAYAAGDDTPWTLEAVAGILEPGEDVADLVIREAREEADITVEGLIQIPGIYPSPGGSDEYVWLFCGFADASGAGGVHGKDDEGEDIRVVVMDRGDAMSAIENGRINTAFTVVLLQWLALNLEKIREDIGNP